MIRTGVNRGTVAHMRNGIVPGEVSIIKWADAIGESAKDWLRYAGYSYLADRILPYPETTELPVLGCALAGQLDGGHDPREPQDPDMIERGYYDLNEEDRQDVLEFVEYKRSRAR